MTFLTYSDQAFTVINPVSLALDGTTDDSINLRTELVNISANGGGTLKLVSQDGIYINSIVELDSNTILDLYDCPVYYGANGAFRTQGDISQLPATNKPRLYANVSAAATTIDIVIFGANVTPTVGQQFTIRGENTGTGATINKETGYIASVTNVGDVTSPFVGRRWTIGLTSPLDNSYDVRYTGSGYELAGLGNDYTYFSINTYSASTGNITAGATSVTVNDGSIFTSGDYVYVNDDEDVGFSTSTSDTNKIHNEVVRVAYVSTNTVYFESALYHNYTTAKNAGLSKLNATTNTHIKGAKIHYRADGGTSVYSLRFKYSAACTMVDCEVAYTISGASNYGPSAIGYRIEFSRECDIFNSKYIGKPDSSYYVSGKGYGFVLHGCTDCKLIGTTAINARHGYLLQYGAAGNEIADFHDIGSRISAIDFHGINARNNHVHGGTVVGGPLVTADSTTKTGIKVGNTSHIYGDFDNTIEDIVIHNYDFGGGETGNGIQLLCESGGNVIRNITVHGCDYGIKLTYNSTYDTSVLPKNVIENVHLDRCTQGVTNINGGTNKTIDDVVLRNITSDDCTTHFEMSNLTKITLDGLKVVNPIASAGVYGIKVTTCDELKIFEPTIDGANRGIYIRSCPSAQILRPIFANLAESVVFEDNTGAGNNNGYMLEEWSAPGTTTPTITQGASTGYQISRQGIQSPFTSAYISGLFYSAFPTVSFSNKTLTAGRLYIVGPFLAGDDITVTKLGMYVVTASAAGTKAVYGVYQDVNGLPQGAPIGGISSAATLTDVSTADAEATTDSAAASLAIPLKRGMYYWLAALLEGGPVVNGSSTANPFAPRRYSTSIGQPAITIKLTQAYATTLPTITTTSSDFAAETAPYLWFRV